MIATDGRIPSRNQVSRRSDELLTTTQAAAALGVSRATVMGLLSSGEIDYVMVGSHHRIPAESLRSYGRSRLVSRDNAGEPYGAEAHEEAHVQYFKTVKFGDSEARR